MEHKNKRFIKGPEVHPGENDFITISQEARVMWDYENNEIDPSTIPPSSSYCAIFKCSRGHQFQRKVRAFTVTSKCPKCDFEDNTIVAAKPDIVKWWHYDKNGDDKPESHRKNDATVVWWKCPKCSYSWQSEIASRFAGKDKCPCCDLGIAFKQGVNDALTRCPELALDWDYEKNDVRPENVFIHYNKSVWFKCHICDFSSKSSIAGHIRIQQDGTFKLRTCKKCKGTTTSEQIIQIHLQHPELIKEFISELNNLNFEDIFYNTSMPVVWRCSTCNQVYRSALNTRIGESRSGKGCPFCDHKKPIPGVNDFATRHPELILEWDYNLNNKNPSDYTEFSPQIVNWICLINNDHRWAASINTRSRGMMKCPICRDKKPSHRLPEAQPELLKYWHYEKNKEHSPDYYREFSNELVYWKCEHGHSFKNYIFRYSQKGFYCVFCENTQLVPHFNDLLTKYPEIAKEFCRELNTSNPEDFIFNSNKPIVWNCPEGHPPYERPIRERTLDGKGCPVCANTLVVAGINDALSAYPQLNEIWNYEANNGKKPEEIWRGSPQSYSYICKHGHEWSESLTAVINAEYICAYCSDRKALLGFNTLSDRNPELTLQWDEGDSHNLGYSPYDITTSIKVMFSWICSDCGNSFLSRIQDRITDETKCPYCSGKKAISGVNSLKALYPDDTKEYSDENEYDADMLLPTYSKPVYWNCCTCGLQWSSSVRDRINGTANCPYCNGRKAIRGKNSLKALYPEYAAEIITDDNRNPDDILPTYATKVRWKCAVCYQIWSSTVDERVNWGAVCPYCSGKKAIPGLTSFAATEPKLMEEWNVVANWLLCDPDKLFPNSIQDAWWICKACRRDYNLSIKKRVMFKFRQKVACPYCKGYRRVKHRLL